MARSKITKRSSMKAASYTKKGPGRRHRDGREFRQSLKNSSSPVSNFSFSDLSKLMGL